MIIVIKFEMCDIPPTSGSRTCVELRGIPPIQSGPFIGTNALFGSRLVDRMKRLVDHSKKSKLSIMGLRMELKPFGVERHGLTNDCSVACSNAVDNVHRRPVNISTKRVALLSGHMICQNISYFPNQNGQSIASANGGNHRCQQCAKTAFQFMVWALAPEIQII